MCANPSTPLFETLASTMAADRLAALRAQQGGRGNQYSQLDGNGSRYELSDMQGGSSNYNAPTKGDMSTFWAEVTAVQDLLREYNDNISHVSTLQQRSLNNINDQQTIQQLDQLAASNRRISKQLKDRIKALQAQGGDSREGQTRRQQAALLKEKFQTALQNYQQVEQKQRNATKNQMERQYRIVKPDASPEEIRAVVDDSGGQIFQQALLNSDQLGRSRAAYREVQERHNDIVKITETMRELQQLMNEMAMMVEEQGEVIENVEKTMAEVETEVETGYKHTETAKQSAMSARKKKWICFWIVVVLLIIIAIAVVIQLWRSGAFGSPQANNSASTKSVHRRLHIRTDPLMLERKGLHDQ